MFIMDTDFRRSLICFDANMRYFQQNITMAKVQLMVVFCYLRWFTCLLKEVNKDGDFSDPAIYSLLIICCVYACLDEEYQPCHQSKI